MLKITKPVLIFCDVDCYDLIDECLTELGNGAKMFTISGTRGRSQPIEILFQETHEEDSFIPFEVDGQNEAAMILCTSGTTGLPKGVCLSHATLLDVQNKRCDLSHSTDVMLSFSSLYWSSGVAVLVRGTLIGATRIITTDPFTPELMLRIIEQYKVTYSMNSMHQIVMLMKSDRFKKTDSSSINCIMVAGSKVPLHVKNRMIQQLPNGELIIGYGMTQIGGPISYDFPMTGDKDTIGRLVDGISIKIIDEKGNRCGLNENGEICIQTCYPFCGYYDNEKATKEAIDAEGFFATGDNGYFDEDGNLYLSGRKKELLKYRSMQISPSEIDAFLTQSPDIESACVVGITDEMSSDLPTAVVVRSENSNISEKHVFDMVADHFADHYKLRGGVFFVDHLPTTSSGKVLRRLVKETAIALYNKRRVSEP